MPFGLSNAPATFQNFMKDIMREHLDIFCVVYVYDLLDYCITKEEYTAHVRTILTKLPEAGIFCKPETCKFIRNFSFLS